MKNKVIAISKNLEEPNMHLLTVTVSKEDVNDTLDIIFNFKHPHIKFDGYREGKVPRDVFEEKYGKDVFISEAVDKLLENAIFYIEHNYDFNIECYGKVTILQASHDKDMIFEIEYATKPVVTLGQYKNLKANELSVSSEEIEAVVNQMRSDNADWIPVHRSACIGDMVNINFEGYIIENGCETENIEGSNNLDITLGSYSYLPAFEDQIVGHKKTEKFRITLKFPEDYSNDRLCGKDAAFYITINCVYEKKLPEAGDEFANSLGYSSYNELFESVQNDLLATAQNAEVNRLVEIAASNAELHIPEIILQKRAEINFEEYKQTIESKGMTLETYLLYTNMTEAELLEINRKTVEENLRKEYVLVEIADAENLTVTDEELNAVFEDLSRSYYESVEKIKEILGAEGIEGVINDLKCQKAQEFIAVNAFAE